MAPLAVQGHSDWHRTTEPTGKKRGKSTDHDTQIGIEPQSRQEKKRGKSTDHDTQDWHRTTEPTGKKRGKSTDHDTQIGIEPQSRQEKREENQPTMTKIQSVLKAARIHQLRKFQPIPTILKKLPGNCKSDLFYSVKLPPKSSEGGQNRSKYLITGISSLAF